MKALIFAAGKGVRMGALCSDQPKVLLPLVGKPLLVHHIERLKEANVQDIVLNVSHMADKIKKVLGNGSHWGVHLAYSEEPYPLETGGGMLKALPLLGDDPFITVSGDIWTDYPFARLPATLDGMAHLVLNDRLEGLPVGDFTLQGGRIANTGINSLNFAGIGVYHPELLKEYQPGVFKLYPLLREAATRGALTGEYYSGRWFNIGTPSVYRQAQRQLGVTA